MEINGAIASGVTDWESGMALGMKSNGNFDIELACAGNYPTPEEVWAVHLSIFILLPYDIFLKLNKKKHRRGDT